MFASSGIFHTGSSRNGQGWNNRQAWQWQPGYDGTHDPNPPITIETAAAANASVGELNQTLGALTLSSTGSLSITGALSQPLGALTLSSTGQLSIRGTLTQTLGSLTLASTGQLSITGALTQTLGAVTLSSTGQLSITGTFNQTLGALTLTAEGALGAAPAVATSTGAGRSKRSKRRKHRYFVEIDGQDFEVESVEEAKELLTKAKSLATQVVQEKRATVVPQGIRVPQIRTPNKELVPIVKQYREDIRDLYDDLKRDLEIRALMAEADEAEEEAIIRLLM